MQYEAMAAYTGVHVPTGEEWWIIGVDVGFNKICAAGWPPTMADLSDMKDMTYKRPLNDEELEYRRRRFGSDECWNGGFSVVV